ncbi:hypothetical protein ACFLZI_01455 [Nitrospirota bacterium]
MRHISLDIANRIYNNCAKFEINRVNVESAELKDYCFALKTLINQIGELTEETFWKQALSPLRRYRYELCSSPLPFNCPSPATIDRIESLAVQVDSCNAYYPNYSEAYEIVVNKAQSLITKSDNPLLDSIESGTLSNNKNIAILIKEPRLVSYVEQILYDVNISVVTPSQLKGDLVFDDLVIVGPTSWFSSCEFIFHTLRACQLHLFKFYWLSDRWKPEPLFASNETTPFIKRFQSNSIIAPPDLCLEPQEILPPQISWNTLMTKVKTSATGSEIQEEQVEARLLLLEGEKAVFIDADESAKSLLIDFDTGQPEIIKNKNTAIEPESYILLRTSGGGDLIVPIADRILGDQAKSVRAKQLVWKLKLLKKVEDKGLLEVSIDLLDAGSDKAKEVNVRNWISYRNIKTADIVDFNAIMKIIGLESEAEDFWNAMELIDSAHRKAGHYIKKLLLEKVLEADINKIISQGRMDFDISEEGKKSSLSAIRVVGVSDSIVTVSISQLGHMVEVKDELWQG